MKILIIGATGMVGQGVLKECLHSNEVSEVIIVTRPLLDEPSAKLSQIIVPDFAKIDSDPRFLSLTEIDACFYCLGVSSARLCESQYTAVNYDLTLKIASVLARQNARLTFTYVSGAGTDSSGKGRSMWARVKGKTEDALRDLGFSQLFLFRPGLIQPLEGITSKTKSYRIFYKLMAPVFPVLAVLAPKTFVTTKQIGLAMLNAVKNGYQKQILEVEDIVNLASAP